MPSIPSAVLQEELRVTLDAAGRTLRRLLHERAAGGVAPEAASLPDVRDRLLRCATALEPFSGSAKLLYALASLVQSYAAHPQALSEASAAAVERASDAVIEHLAALARGKQVSAVALFPQYRELLMLLGEERGHPAELWTPPQAAVRPAPAVEFPLEGAPAGARPAAGPAGSQAWAWIDGSRVDHAARAALKAEPLAYAPALRSRMDTALLQMVKAGGGAAALPLRDIALGLAAGETQGPRRAFWQLASAYFEALALELIAADVYVKRTASRVLLQYSAFSRDQSGAAVAVADGLAQDLLFFCAQAAPPNLLTAVQAAPVLATVRRLYGLGDAQPVNYEAQRYGRFDPTALAQARQRIRAALEGWAGFNTEPDLLYPNSIPDSQRFEALTALFSQLGVSLLTLQPERRELVRALLQAADYIARAASWRPSLSGARLATEVDLALCFLDAAHEDLDPAEDMLKQERSDLLALRIDRAVDAAESGVDQPAEPFQPWMAELLGLPAPTESVFQTLYELEHGGVLESVEPDASVGEPAGPVEPRFTPEPPAPAAEGADSADHAAAASQDDQAPASLPTLTQAVAAFSVEAATEDGQRPEPLWDPAAVEASPTGQVHAGADAVVEDADALAPAPIPMDEVAPTGLSEAIDTRETAEAPETPETTGAEIESADTVPAQTPPAPAVDAGQGAFLDTARQSVHAGLDAVAGLLSGLFDTDLGNAAPASTEPLAQVFEQLARVAAAEQAAGMAEAEELAEACLAVLPTLADGAATRPEVLHLVLDALHQIGLWVEDVAAGRAPQPLADPLRQAVAHLGEVPSLPLADPGAEAQGSDDIQIGAPTDAPAEGDALAQVPDVPLADPAADEPALDLAALEAAQASGRDREVREVGEMGEEEPPPFRQTRFVDGEAQFQQIGPLRLPLADYKAFLNEADEWSRLLSAGLNEWSLDLGHQVRRALPVNLLALAHALAGSAAGLGLEAITTLARTLEQAMTQLRGERELQVPATEAARIFLLAAEDIRYLLHQLKAGELKMPEPGLLDELAAAAGIEAPVLLAPASLSAAQASGLADPRSPADDEPDLFSAAMPGGAPPPSVLHSEWGYASIPDAASLIDAPDAAATPPASLPLRQRLEARVDEVHGGLHELDLMLERLRSYLKSAGLPPEALKDIAAVQRHLQEALGELEEDLRELDDEEGR